ncbi:hypothetical protein EGW08_008236 [Elysia chlorotica]|uniref:Uncharacterized protein n=1 Tax=Elysia chlorotica TaxID=188477 RepID=A0A433TR28_ELYCH|nr:hypothetical protein EGW08_008236 [Elysia chlorotica]
MLETLAGMEMSCPSNIQFVRIVKDGVERRRKRRVMWFDKHKLGLSFDRSYKFYGCVVDPELCTPAVRFRVNMIRQEQKGDLFEVPLFVVKTRARKPWAPRRTHGTTKGHPSDRLKQQDGVTVQMNPGLSTTTVLLRPGREGQAQREPMAGRVVDGDRRQSLIRVSVNVTWIDADISFAICPSRGHNPSHTPARLPRELGAAREPGVWTSLPIFGGLHISSLGCPTRLDQGSIFCWPISGAVNR